MPRRNREPFAIPAAWEQLWQIFCPWVTGTDEIRIAKPTRIKSSSRQRRAKLSLVLATCLTLTAIQTAQAAEQTDVFSDASFIKVSLTKNTDPTDHAYPELFGRSETRYTNMQPFTKWSGVLKRFATEFPDSIHDKSTQKWLTFLQKSKDLDPADQIDAVNRYMNKVKFISDQDNYHVSDYWATPMEFLRRGGDCEDYAIAKYISLRALGFKEDQMRIAIVYDSEMNMPHALLVMYEGDQALILDNQTEDVKSAASIDRYKPIYSINQYAWWRH